MTAVAQWFEPENTEQAMKMAKVLADSQFCPQSFRGKPGDVLCALMYGASIGMSPVQALQGVAVVNGRPALFGDSLIAVASGHPDFEDIVEEIDDRAMVATCTIKRRGRSPVVRTFSQQDAAAAGLWKRKGPWTEYPKRMLQMRARGFAIRDAFPDALRGIISYEEAMDTPVEKPVQATVRGTEPPVSRADQVMAKLGGEGVPEEPATEPTVVGSPKPPADAGTDYPGDPKREIVDRILGTAEAAGHDTAWVREQANWADGVPEFKRWSDLSVEQLELLEGAVSDSIMAERDGE